MALNQAFHMRRDENALAYLKNGGLHAGLPPGSDDFAGWDRVARFR